MVSYSRFMIVVVVSLLFGESVGFAQGLVRPGFRFIDDAFATSTVSGVAGTPVTTEILGGNFAVYGIKWTERRDRPCSFTALLEDFDTRKSYREATRHRCGPNGPKAASEKSTDFLKLPTSGAVGFLTTLEVCMNAAGTRVKGVRMGGVRLDFTNGVLIQAFPANLGNYTQSATRSNCNKNERGYPNWSPMAVCPTGSLAIGLIGHYETGGPPRALTGMALRCQNLEFTQGGVTRRVP